MVWHRSEQLQIAAHSHPINFRHPPTRHRWPWQQDSVRCYPGYRSSCGQIWRTRWNQKNAIKGCLFSVSACFANVEHLPTAWWFEKKVGPTSILTVYASLARNHDKLSHIIPLFTTSLFCNLCTWVVSRISEPSPTWIKQIQPTSLLLRVNEVIFCTDLICMLTSWLGVGINPFDIQTYIKYNIHQITSSMISSSVISTKVGLKIIN